MRIEVKGLLAALAAGLFVVGASYGVSALVAPHVGGHQKSDSGAASTASVSSAQLVTTGRGFYAQSCASCHGDNAEGGVGPTLHNLGQSDTQIAAVIKNGVPGKMPTFADKYAAPQQQALVAYVQSLK